GQMHETEPVATGLDSMVAGPEIDLSEIFEPRSAAVVMPEAATETDREDAGLAEMLHDLEMGRDEQLCETDYETRYNLGIAYKEVGLIDEAISEFRLAATDEGHVLACSSMLGLCFIEKGMPELAMEWFEKGLEAVGWWEGVEMG